MSPFETGKEGETFWARIQGLWCHRHLSMFWVMGLMICLYLVKGVETDSSDCQYNVLESAKFHFISFFLRC